MFDTHENQSKMTLGKKLMIAFAGMLAATLALSVASLTGIRGLRNEFDNTAIRAF